MILLNMKIRVKGNRNKINKGMLLFEKKIKKMEKFFPSEAEVIIEAELGLASLHHQKEMFIEQRSR